MKTGMNLLLWTTEVTESHYPLLEKLKQWGFDGVELPLFAANPAHGRELGKRLDDLGLERTAVTIVTPETNPISEDAKVRSKAVDQLRGVVETCREAGVPLLCGPYHSPVGGLVGRGRTKDEWKWAVDVLREVADTAKDAGVTLALEYLNRFECYFLNCAADTAAFVQEVGHPSLRMMYDTFHANIEEKDIPAAIRGCADVTAHVHISENDRATPGEGHVDWDATFAALKETGYDGWLVIEAFGQALPDLAAATCIWRRMFPSEEHVAREGLRFMRERWAR
jgi:D-psicose/D-tagatose/L-ribulose 3-epimerase